MKATMTNRRTQQWYLNEQTGTWRRASERESPIPATPMNLRSVAARVREGETVTFTAKGHSMHPRIRNDQMVRVGPVKDVPKVNDVALAKVKGRYYLHLISAEKDGRFQISNMKGRVNGWASEIVGIWLGPK